MSPIAVALGLPEILLIVFAILLLFGARKLPELARSMGSSVHEFKKGMSEGGKDKEAPAKPDTRPAGGGSSEP